MMEAIEQDSGEVIEARSPASPPPDARALRRELADCIADRNAAEGRARVARQVANRANAAKDESSQIVNRLKAEREAAQRASVQRHAKALADALRGGGTEPAAPVPPAGGTEALDLAEARLAALDAATRQLATEAEAADAAVSRAANTCQTLVDAILAADAAEIAREWVAAVQLGWQLEDQLSGLVRVRNGALLPHDEQTRILERVNRRKAAVTANRLLIEDHAWKGYLTDIEAKQEKRWLDYSRRLMLDASATLETDREG